ncbi:hypothetical protein B0H16DRAFT_1862024 [Mycena metata]|uniref:Uncharacterized protein n=1 Tax=Mycena metata TaxID=1033252 RepID=A0AAD7IG76_9AGAR|nr:hypothetical protein B0H16DRAFT_1862024 [Mycena metata]
MRHCQPVIKTPFALAFKLFLPDFATLESQGRHSIFQVDVCGFRHPPIPSCKRSRTTSYIVGPGLLSALNLVRNNGPSTTNDDPWGYGQATAEPTEPRVISPEEVRQLTGNAVVVNSLEDIFSFRHKDRNFQSSRLSAVESLRFTRAMFRIMLFEKTFPANNTVYIDDADTEEEVEIRTARRDFFAMFSTQHLREIYTVNSFIDSLGTWLVLPAAVLLQAYQERDPQLIESHFDSTKQIICSNAV